MRHAKSSWKDRDLDDRERPLKKRGVKDCHLLGQALQLGDVPFEQVFCSVAQRAQQTASEVLAAAQLSHNVHLEEDLYEFNSRRLLRWVRSIEHHIESVLVIGHNPAFTDLCNDLSGAEISNLPTCGYAIIECDVNHWRGMSDDCGELTSLITPRMLREENIRPEQHLYR